MADLEQGKKYLVIHKEHRFYNKVVTAAESLKSKKSWVLPGARWIIEKNPYGARCWVNPEWVEAVDKQPTKCICALAALVVSGCKCGGI